MRRKGTPIGQYGSDLAFGVPCYVLYSNRIDIVNPLKDDTPIELYKLLPLDFKKFIKLKKGLINKELRKLLPKKYYNFTDMCL